VGGLLVLQPDKAMVPAKIHVEHLAHCRRGILLATSSIAIMTLSPDLSLELFTLPEDGLIHRLFDHQC
jgi:hypothetical protein